MKTLVVREAGEMMAHHLYAPLRWDGRTKLPMVLVLHGGVPDGLPPERRVGIGLPESRPAGRGGFGADR